MPDHTHDVFLNIEDIPQSSGDIADLTRGLVRTGEVEMTVTFDVATASSTCTNTPCHVCGFCRTCGDPHIFTGRGCTDDACPLRQ